ncbi:MAG: biotin/lipoate A/B protein ligase family protein [Bacteroidales bacterium]|nr:biotin/lipoate A/B protein ligase family protein [Bacteroidales bacterium]
MYLIENSFTDAYYNLSLEEYFFKEKPDEDFIILYINEPSIIIGKHQNAYAEINYLFAKRHNIKIVRRLSGGGTVYHDDGNVNFTFIKNVRDGFAVNFKSFLQPVCEILKEIGLDAVIGSKNEILIDGFKISGNAEHVFKNRMLHHGTLLFSSNLELLKKAIHGKINSYKSKSVQSNRSTVANIVDLMSNKISIDDFIQNFLSGLIYRMPGIKPYTLTKFDIESINKLAEEKYKKWDWNYAYSPDYEFENQIEHFDHNIHIQLGVKKGFINFCNFSVRNLNNHTNYNYEPFQIAIKGKRHKEDDLFSVIKKYHDSLCLLKLSPEEICLLFF